MLNPVRCAQVSGTKSWRVWEPAWDELPLRDQLDGKAQVPSTRCRCAHHPRQACDATERENVRGVLCGHSQATLEPGDVLYIPRGHSHVAETPEASGPPSIHLTNTLHAQVPLGPEDTCSVFCILCAAPYSAILADWPACLRGVTGFHLGVAHAAGRGYRGRQSLRPSHHRGLEAPGRKGRHKERRHVRASVQVRVMLRLCQSRHVTARAAYSAESCIDWPCAAS